MSFNQYDFQESLGYLCSKTREEADYDSFIFNLLSLLGISKTTISMLKNPKSGTNVAPHPCKGEVANRHRIYFKPVSALSNEVDVLKRLQGESVIEQAKIRVIMVTDFNEVLLYDTKLDIVTQCGFLELPDHYNQLLPLAGLEKSKDFSEHKVDIQASEKMGRLFDHIKRNNNIETESETRVLNVFLARILFCFFADDTGIFPDKLFKTTLEQINCRDGSETRDFLFDLFTVLDEPESSLIRASKPSYLLAFPYVNGGLFKEELQLPLFDSKTKRVLLECARMNWSEINPDIFGSMFQAAVDIEQRGSLGQHYTSVSNVKKLIDPLFMNELNQEFQAIRDLSDNNKYKNNKLERLDALLDRMSKIAVCDPTLGGAGSLLVAYKELRWLEINILIERISLTSGIYSSRKELSLDYRSVIKLSNFYGMEIDHFAVQIATLALWFAEHQMNLAFKKVFGSVKPTLPLRESGSITLGDSLKLDWHDYFPSDPNQEIYIIGNPPYAGRGSHTKEQSENMNNIFKGFKKYKALDYVACWFWKSAQFIVGKRAKVALVSTCSISQGAQVARMFPSIFKLGVSIAFAYQSFPWRNSAKYNADVHVVIIGLTSQPKDEKSIYKLVDGVWHEERVKNISPYLVAGGDIVVEEMSKPIQPRSKMGYGSMARDGGRLLLDVYEKEELEANIPWVSDYIKPVLGAKEFLNAEQRWCLWFRGCDLSALQEEPLLKERFDNVRDSRLASTLKSTKKSANRPHEFTYISQPTEGSYILVPRVSSEKRLYIPIGFFDCDVICTDRNQIIPNGTLFDFAMLNSAIHNDWMRLVTGRLKSDYNYSNTIVYNTFPYPPANDEQREYVERLARDILVAREANITLSLSDMYDPELMPLALKEAHRRLDEAIDTLYRPQGFRTTEERLEHLLVRYSRLLSNA